MFLSLLEDEVMDVAGKSSVTVKDSTDENGTEDAEGNEVFRVYVALS